MQNIGAVADPPALSYNVLLPLTLSNADPYFHHNIRR